MDISQRRRLTAFVAGIALFVSVSGSSPFQNVFRAQGGCTGPMPPLIPTSDLNYNRGIPHDSEKVYFVDSTASAEERFQVEAAFKAWQSALTDGGFVVTFARTKDQALAKTSGIEVVIGPTNPGDPASFEVVGRDADTYELKAARITVDLRGGPGPGRLYFDPDQVGYAAEGSVPGAISKALMHEVGHTLGLHHFPGRACTEQRSGTSVMNGMCGINDHGATLNGVLRPPALANKPAPCDVAAVLTVAASPSQHARR